MSGPLKGIPSRVLLIPVFAVLLLTAVQYLYLTGAHPARVYDPDHIPTNVATLWDDLNSSTRRILTITFSGAVVLGAIILRHGLGPDSPSGSRETNDMVNAIAPSLAGLLTFNALGDASTKWTKWRQLDRWHASTNEVARRSTWDACAALTLSSLAILAVATTSLTGHTTPDQVDRVATVFSMLGCIVTFVNVARSRRLTTKATQKRSATGRRRRP